MSVEPLDLDRVAGAFGSGRAAGITRVCRSTSRCLPWSGMRVVAAALRNDAAGIAVVAADVASRVDRLEFFGPAAERLDARVGLAAKAAGRLADQLIATAGLLDRSASDVEAEQRARERQLERLRRELAPKAAS